MCANSPQSACFEVMLWMKGVANFEHHDRLADGVAELLADPSGESMELNVASIPASDGSPAIPADAVIRKIELSSPEAWVEPWAQMREAVFADPDRRFPPSRVEETPYPPPRNRVS